MPVYIWSDLHLGHTNIIGYENRPFKDIDEMDKFIISNWRKHITRKDKIINLGDVSLGYSKERLTKLISNLPGHKILILGNYDRGKSLKGWYDVGFNEVYRYPIIWDNFYILSHEPVYINTYMPYVNIHGHTHGKSSDNKQKVNVSVEVLNYKPILFDDIMNKFNLEKRK